MKKEYIIGLCGLAFLIMLVLALFTQPGVQTTAQESFHEINNIDFLMQNGYSPAAYCPIPQQAAGQGQGYYPQGGMMQQVAMPGAPPIFAGDEKPVLIKQMGAEVMPFAGGKVKITGVMGGSWANKAGLKAGDIILRFDTKKITSLKQFQDLVAVAPPEKDYKVDYLRGSQQKKCLLTVGEGEMEGFTPIPVPK